MRIDRIKFATALAEKDIKVYQLAQMSGLSRITVSSVKSGKSCSKDTAEKLVGVLGPQILEQEE